MFLGEYQAKFSGNGRIILPHKFRHELGKMWEIVLSRGLDGCIFGFSKAVWEKEAKKQMDKPLTDVEGRELRRYLFSAAENVELDEQGRFIIPKPLLLYAQIKDEAVVIGAGDHFEIWNNLNWQQIVKKLLK